MREEAKSKQWNGKPRKYQDLIKGRFDLDSGFHLEREDDPDTISNKWFDFSKTTITKLIEDGRFQALNKLYENELKDRGKSHAHQQLKLFIDSVEKSKENGEMKLDHANRLIDAAMAVSEHPRKL